MSITWSIKTFDALSNKELYQILKLRNEVFIVEQKCAYDDIDGKDLLPSHHLFCMAQDVVIAYARIFGPGIIYAEACLGRICSSSAHRKQGLGKALMQHALAHTEQLYPAQSIRISAQCYLRKFYEDFGFRVVSDVYLEDGIEHFQMLLSK